LKQKDDEITNLRCKLDNLISINDRLKCNIDKNINKSMSIEKNIKTINSNINSPIIGNNVNDTMNYENLIELKNKRLENMTMSISSSEKYMKYGNLDYQDDIVSVNYNDNFKKLNLYDNKHKIVDMCINKEGSRIIQDAIESKDINNIEIIYDAIKDNIFNISNDQSGN